MISFVHGEASPPTSLQPSYARGVRFLASERKRYILAKPKASDGVRHGTKVGETQNPDDTDSESRSADEHGDEEHMRTSKQPDADETASNEMQHIDGGERERGDDEGPGAVSLDFHYIQILIRT